MKKKFRSLLALAMALAMVLALTACGSSSTSDADEEDTSAASAEDEYVADYTFVDDGEVLYSDDNCSITFVSLKSNDDDDGSTLTLDMVNNYEGSLGITITAYDWTYNDDGTVSGIEAVETVAEISDEGETEAELSLGFSGGYNFFEITVDTYSEFVTQEQIDSGEYLDLMNDTLLSNMKVNFPLTVYARS